MAKPFSNDLRWKMVESVRCGLSRRKTSERFQVSVSCVIKLMQRIEATGDVASARFGGFKSSPRATREADIRSWVRARSDITPAELQAKLDDAGTTGRDRAVPATARPDAKKDRNRRRTLPRGHRRSAAQMARAADGPKTRTLGFPR
jgi:transposase